jgi:hypothetical protein
MSTEEKGEKGFKLVTFRFIRRGLQSIKLPLGDIINFESILI